jgi:hypothetical protein
VLEYSKRAAIGSMLCPGTMQCSTTRLMLLDSGRMAARSFSIVRPADVTGRDTYLLVEALTFTVEALSGLAIQLRPDNNIADMKRLVEEFVKHDAGLAPLTADRPS